MQLRGTAGILALLFCFLVASPAQASTSGAEACHCEQYKGLESFTSLADEIADIGIAAIHDDGPEFEKIEQKRRALRLRIEADSLIPQECKRRLYAKLAHVSGTVFLRIIGSGGANGQSAPVFTEANTLYRLYNSTYSQFLFNQWANMCGSKTTNACIQGAIGKSWKAFSSAVQLSPGGLFMLPADQLKIVQAYQQVLSAGNEQAALNLIRSRKDGLTDQQFFTVVQMVGARLNADYDMTRAGQGFGAKGIVNGSQLLAAAQYNTTLGMPDSFGDALAGYVSNNQESSGVCRDISTFLAKMLQARGLPNVVVVGYEIGGPDFHVVALAGDRSDRTLFHSFSYGTRIDKQGLDGAEGLLVNAAMISLPDTTLNYIVAKPEGATIALVPSEMEKFLAEAAGFDIHQLDPLARETSSMLGTSLSAGSDDGRTTANTHVVAGQDGNGARYLGVGETVSYHQNTATPGKFGAVVMDQVRPANVYGTAVDENLGVAYLQVEQHVAPTLKPNPSTKITFDNSVTAVVMAGELLRGAGPGGAKLSTGDSESPDQNTGVFGGDLRARSEVRADYASDSGKLHSAYRAGVEIAPGVGDIRSLFASPTVTLSGAYAGTTQTLRVRDMMLFATTTAAIDLLGSRGIAELGVAGQKWAASAFVAGRITNGTSLYEDNSVRRAGLSLTYQPTRHLRLGLTGQMPVEGDAPLSQANIMGSSLVNF